MVSGVKGLFKINKYNTIEKAVVYINGPAIGDFEKTISRRAVKVLWSDLKPDWRLHSNLLSLRIFTHSRPLASY